MMQESHARRRFLSIVGVVAAMAAFCACASNEPSVSPAQPASNERQNVLFVVIDTLRADYVGGPAATPTLDALARSGVVFENTVAHAPTTLPAHASLFTARYPTDHGVRTNGLFRLDERESTLAEAFRDAGYDTGGFVGAFVLDARFGLDQGFEHYDDRIADRQTPVHDLSASELPAEEVFDRADEWIRARSEPWFAFVHVFDAHAPYAPPPPFHERYRHDLYAGEVAYIDHALGVFLARLRASGRLDDTLVVVTSDHGEGLGQHGEPTHGMFAYESTLRVPLIMTGGVGLPSGRIVRSRARHVDIAPTIASIAAIEWDDRDVERRGRSLVPLIENDETGDRDSYFESLSYHIERGQAPLRGVYHGSLKYIDVPLEELYDVVADSAETRNLAGERVDDVSRLRRALSDVVGRSASPASTVVDVDDATQRRLQSLGYLSEATPSPRRSRHGAEDDPKTLVELNQQFDDALSAYHAGRTTDAIRLLDAIVRERPTYGSAYKYLANAYHARGEIEAAVNTLEMAIGYGAWTSAIGSQLGAYLVEAGRLREARTTLAQVLEEHPEHVDALQSMALALDMSGERSAALATLQRALDVSPSSASVHANIGAMGLASGDIAGARESLRRALEIDPRLASAWNVLGAAYHAEGNVDAAIDAWTRAAEQADTPMESLYNLGFALVQKDRPADALVHLERFARDASPTRHAHELEDVRWLLERLEEAHRPPQR